MRNQERGRNATADGIGMALRKLLPIPFLVHEPSLDELIEQLKQVESKLQLPPKD